MWQKISGIDNRSAIDGVLVGRVIPDNFALATPGPWEIFEAGEATIVGGTSAVAPLYASLMVLTNQKRASEENARPGFIDSML